VRPSLRRTRRGAARVLAEYKLLAVDGARQQGRHVGIVTVDDALAVAHQRDMDPPRSRARPAREEAKRHAASSPPVPLALGHGLLGERRAT